MNDNTPMLDLAGQLLETSAMFAWQDDDLEWAGGGPGGVVGACGQVAEVGRMGGIACV
jgi:hypothetical protein